MSSQVVHDRHGKTPTIAWEFQNGQKIATPGLFPGVVEQAPDAGIYPGRNGYSFR
jgi:hypothetical protein